MPHPCGGRRLKTLTRDRERAGRAARAVTVIGGGARSDEPGGTGCLTRGARGGRSGRRRPGRAGTDRAARQQAACPASGLMILQAAVLAVLAAISPTALLVAAVYLG